MLHDPRAYLWDVQQAAEALDKFTAGLDAASYAENALVRAAVERQFGIIGEALNRLLKVDPALAERVPHLRTIVGFRNVLIHGYAVVDHVRVWRIKETLLPGLHATVSALLADLGPPDAPARRRPEPRLTPYARIASLGGLALPPFQSWSSAATGAGVPGPQIGVVIAMP